MTRRLDNIIQGGVFKNVDVHIPKLPTANYSELEKFAVWLLGEPKGTYCIAVPPIETFHHGGTPLKTQEVNNSEGSERP